MIGNKSTLSLFSVTIIITIIALTPAVQVSYAIPGFHIMPDYTFHNANPTTVVVRPGDPIPTHLGPSGVMCDDGTTDDLLWTLIDGANNTITLWCKHVPQPQNVQSVSRQFVGYWNHAYIIGFCPFEEGKNTWHWVFGKNNEVIHSEWISRAKNGTSVTFGFSWNTTAPVPQTTTPIL